MDNCKVCNAELGASFKVREMMLGLRDEFDYKQCPSCGTIQINDIPKDIEKYYPKYYYSFKEKVPTLSPLPFLKQLFNGIRIKRKYRKGKSEIFQYLKPLQTRPSERILDIGCGKGKLICEMYNAGFSNVEGVDKFIAEEYNYNYGVKVYKRDLSELKTNSYDLLMMHHVFEHMDEPLQELRKCYDLLKPKGSLMIRIPVVGRAWEIYGADWVQLDAPRHFFIHSRASMEMLADQAGFNLTQVVYDSNAFQFYVSEMYKRDIEFVDVKIEEYRNFSGMFSEAEMEHFNSMADDFNRNKTGDQAIFYLQKK